MKKILKAKIDGRKFKDNFEIIEAILDERNINDIDSFLRPTEEDLIPFEQMKGIDDAYRMIDDAIVMGEKFAVHEDIDADGADGGTIITKYLQARGADVVTYINQGKKHGVAEFDLSLLDDIDVLIVIDSIDNDPEVYRKILATNTKLCVLDHHLISQELLDANLPFVLVSSANNYPNSELSGAGVALKLVQYCDYMNLESYVDDLGLWLYAAIGICADMCSMKSPENRYIVHKGLSYYNHPLVKKMVGNYLFDSTSIAFSIAPLVNAAMRTNNNETAKQLFLTDNEDEIAELVNQMKGYKEFQNKAVDNLMEDLMMQAESQMDRKCMFFMLPDEIDADVSGLLGNKILSIVQRPLCILRNVIKTDENGEIIKHELSGSMRACGVDSFKDYIEKTGYGWVAGHENAAGVGFDINEFEDFKVAIEEALRDVEFSTTVTADIELSPSQINENLVKQLIMLSRISGKDFPAIKVLIRTDDYEVSTFTSKKHLKVIDNQTGVIIVKWNTDAWQTMTNDKPLVAVGTLANPYYGRKKFLQLTTDEYTQQNN